MNSKQLEALLYNYKNYQARLILLNRDLEHIKANDYVHSSDPFGFKSSKTNKVSDQVANAVISAEEQREEIKREINQIGYIIEKIEISLVPLNEIQRSIIELRYFEGNQWWQVAQEVGYSEDYSKRLRKKALNTMLRVLN